MTRILLLYGTTDGQTAKIARFLGEELQALGARVDVVDARRDDPDPEGYQGVIVAASVHAGGYQRPVVHWVRAHARSQLARQTAFVSVCLGILQKDPKVLAELDAIKQRFIAATGWSPPICKMVAGALPYSRYGWLKRLVMRSIVRKAGGDTDTSRDYEYTDWTELAVFAADFHASLVPRPREEAACRPGSALSAAGSPSRGRQCRAAGSSSASVRS